MITIVVALYTATITVALNMLRIAVKEFEL
jgi:hypothetical protein